MRRLLLLKTVVASTLVVHTFLQTSYETWKSLSTTGDGALTSCSALVAKRTQFVNNITVGFALTPFCCTIALSPIFSHDESFPTRTEEATTQWEDWIGSTEQVTDESQVELKHLQFAA